jgi:hypothetical protein
VYLGIYAAAMLVITPLVSNDGFASVIPSLLFGLVVATAVLVLLVKFGWNPPILNSRAQNEALRAERAAARSASTASTGGTSAGPREKPAPTKRTSTGHSQHPRRTTKTRKR